MVPAGNQNFGDWADLVVHLFIPKSSLVWFFKTCPNFLYIF